MSNRIVATLFVFATLGACSQPEPPLDRPGTTLQAELPRAPNTWFYRQRASAGEGVPVAALSQALDASRQRGALRSTPGTWQAIGPFNVGGRVTALGVDPSDGDRMWVGTAAGGVFLSEDEGATWAPVFDDQVALSIGALAVHPTDSDVVYVGTGEDNGGGFSYDGEGVFKTTDGGLTWNNMGLAEVRRIGKLAVDPTDGDRVFVAAGGDWFNRDIHRGIYRSIDGGQNWQKVLFVADDAGGIDVAIDPGNPDRIYASIWQRFSAGTSWYIGGSDSGIWRSLDGGDSWTRLTTGLPAVAGRIGLAVAPTLPQFVYANIITTSGSLDGIYLSVDAGDNWVKKSGFIQFSGFSYYFSQIRVDPTNHKTVYALDQQLHRSTDSASNFTTVANSVHVDWHDLIVEPGGRWIAGTDGGFYVSQDFGNAWTHSETLAITQFYDLGIDTLQPQRRFAGAQDNGTVRTTNAGLSDWVNVLGGDGLQCEVDYTNSDKVYASAQNGNLFRSTDGGNSFVSATTGIDGSERSNWNSPFILDPATPSTLYTGTTRVYRSIDSAQSWSPISPDLTGPAPPEEHHPHLDAEARTESGTTHLENLIRATVTVISVSPLDSGIIWAGTDDGNVWVTDDGGSSWNQVNPAGPAYWVTDVAADRFDVDTAYLTVTGYRQGDALPYVRVTRDLGGSWSDVSGDLPQVPVTTVVADPDWLGRLFVGNDLGVYVTDDGGLTWSAMRDGMPYVVAMDLVRHDPSDTLFAGTHARSIFSFDLAQLGDADGDGDGVDNNSDCALSDGGAFATPGAVDGVTVDRGPSGEAILTWNSLAAGAGTGTRYDVARGALGDLPTLGTGGSIGVDCDVPGTTISDATAVGPGAGVYFLLRARNACGTGGWGTDGDGLSRLSGACP